ncbi:MAG: nucleotide exchange factor GrpE [Xanthomonadales bacterium]|nr:nucleotide exchange factor GrpE [Xanthomonadales bacterium]
MENTDPNATPIPEGDDAVQGDMDTLTRQLAEAESKLAEMRETVLRERADLDNQRKRMQRELEQARLYANERLLSALLPALDNLERGLAAEGDLAALRGGVELTLRELLRVAEASGLRPVGAIGDAFDPEHHEAMSMAEGTGHAPGHIVSVMQKGYVLNDRLLRPALVSVSR